MSSATSTAIEPQFHLSRARAACLPPILPQPLDGGFHFSTVAACLRVRVDIASAARGHTTRARSRQNRAGASREGVCTGPGRRAVPGPSWAFSERYSLGRGPCGVETSTGTFRAKERPENRGGPTTAHERYSAGGSPEPAFTAKTCENTPSQKLENIQQSVDPADRFREPVRRRRSPS